MLDFTSALYLGMQHGSAELRRWTAFTTGRPAALAEIPSAGRIERALAELQGCEDAVLGPSTLHLAWDLFGLLALQPITILMDAGTYAISRWGVQRAAMRGAPVRTFPHHDATALAVHLADMPAERRPVIVSDGLCPACGRVAPLAHYLDLARGRRGLLVIDDTQALGVLGHSPIPAVPYGRGGAGSLPWCGIRHSDALVFASLAKGFGVPVAMLAGPHDRIREFRTHSLTRVHCSPPSTPVLRAAENALFCNQREGDARRAALLANVRHFRRGVGLPDAAHSGPALFPVQHLRIPGSVPPARLHARLLERGVRTVLQRGDDGRPTVTVLLTARHRPGEIDSATALIRDARQPRAPSLTLSRKEPHHEQPACPRI